METVRRLVFVVADDREDLFTSLSRTFAGDDTVEVVMDRRRSECRDAPPASPPAERRTGDRRVREDTERRLRERGYAVVAVVAPRRARAGRRAG